MQVNESIEREKFEFLLKEAERGIIPKEMLDFWLLLGYIKPISHASPSIDHKDDDDLASWDWE